MLGMISRAMGYLRINLGMSTKNSKDLYSVSCVFGSGTKRTMLLMPMPLKIVLCEDVIHRWWYSAQKGLKEEEKTICRIKQQANRFPFWPFPYCLWSILVVTSACEEKKGHLETSDTRTPSEKAKFYRWVGREKWLY